jgi:hypothetical protein
VRSLTNNLLAQLYGERSDDPLLMLVTLTHTSFTTLRLVNNTEDVISRGNTHIAFPMRINLPAEDGVNVLKSQIQFDNVSLDLIDEIRSVTTPIDTTIELVLASDPDTVEISFNEFKISNVRYDSRTINADLFLDDFLHTELTSERYTPTIYPGLFT